MNSPETYIDPDSTLRIFESLSLGNEKIRLVREIGRLNNQLYRCQSLDNQEKRSEFLRREIAILKVQLNYLRDKSGSD